MSMSRVVKGACSADSTVLYCDGRQPETDRIITITTNEQTKSQPSRLCSSFHCLRLENFNMAQAGHQRSAQCLPVPRYQPICRWMQRMRLIIISSCRISSFYTRLANYTDRFILPDGVAPRNDSRMRERRSSTDHNYRAIITEISLLRNMRLLNASRRCMCIYENADE